MEEDKKQILHGECPRKLNLNVPPLSTRRPFGVTTDKMLMLAISNTTSKDTTNMVPFSWERIPGEPKDKETNDNFGNIDLPPLPKPPPGRDVDDGEEEYGHNERFSDAIDIFSLAESVDDMEANCKATNDRSSVILEPNGYHSPNFIIQRFLPDAQALAEASVTNKELPLSSSPYANPSFSRAVSIRRSYHSPKGCGLGSFFPWRMKPKPCSVKSPVCDTIIGSNQKQNR
ncbi:hypothetical protein Pfo_004477 [Paulownia fortunei]|nr:hypothetical protein Pfo_004477 [Paulownia fortunei]